jgi:hypothetical protein
MAGYGRGLTERSQIVGRLPLAHGAEMVQAQNQARTTDALKGLSIWLGAAVLGSLIPSPFIEGHIPSLQDLRDSFGLTILFTVPGSGLLVLFFAWLSRWEMPMALKLGMLIPLGAASGALIMIALLFPAALVGLGIAYGSATAVAWVGLHLALYRTPSSP